MVATRPKAANGLGLSTDAALANIHEFSYQMVLLEETEQVQRRLSSLVKTYQLRGKPIHDANIVATMLTHGISFCISDDQDDYEVFSEITVLDSMLK